MLFSTIFKGLERLQEPPRCSCRCPSSLLEPPCWRWPLFETRRNPRRCLLDSVYIIPILQYATYEIYAQDMHQIPVHITYSIIYIYHIMLLYHISFYIIFVSNIYNIAIPCVWSRLPALCSSAPFTFASFACEMAASTSDPEIQMIFMRYGAIYYL